MKMTDEIRKEVQIAKTTKDPQVLRKLLRNTYNIIDNWVSQYVVSNPNCPPDILKEMFEQGNEDWISFHAVKNPNCPEEILVEILKKGNDNYMSQCAAENPSCPKEMLVEVLKRGNDGWVSRCAAENINCPDEARINWMYSTGRIKKEDSSKHIIEYENNKEDDFQDLKDLL